MKKETKPTTPTSLTDNERGQWLAAMRRARTELGMTQMQFAAAIGMSKDAVASWECGRSRICRTSALRMSVRLQRNIIAGNTDPVAAEDLIQARVKEYERSLRRLLGV
ncbi:MAG: helix-turn-helix transcriptional regulator [Verrucomicrobia bacterium]|jgi:DNA-binding transcriptional regulator YiaG|nr:helix-turn-helix transcriptional regulator [Verrucomicrobiota bacterium]